METLATQAILVYAFAAATSAKQHNTNPSITKINK